MAAGTAAGDDTDFIPMRVTAKGHRVIHTGTYDEAKREFGRYADGEEFPCPAANVAIFEERGIAVRVVREASGIAADAGTGTGVPARSDRVDAQAVARLAARTVRDAVTGCLVWQGSTANGGYGQISYRRTMYRTHRLSWIAHHGPVPEGQYVCHSCDNPACVAIEHLFLGTPGENYRDMRRKGRLRYNAKLDPAAVGEIKRRLAAGERIGRVAADYAVGYGQILNIKNGRAWREIAAAQR